MATIDNKNFIDMGKAGSFSVIEDPRLEELKEYYRQGIILAEEFIKYYNSFPITYVVESPPKIFIEEEIDEPILTRWEILDL